MVEQVEKNSKDGCAFLSTPSIYFSLKDKEIKAKSKVFDFDEEFGKKDPSCFVKYDFNKVEEIPEELKGTFDMVVIDPPYITEEVWAKYAEASRFLLKEGGLILGSTIDENEEMLKNMLGLHRTTFRPSIPNLVYQYSFYVNYEDDACNEKNPEIAEFD
mmetsp:Transcript_23689/g.21052  ORF Transcript_23689/g.21052 Transcript_23689/m.21052 type:complete len:159 (+) Transcript_23689:52-528(+)